MKSGWIAVGLCFSLLASGAAWAEAAGKQVAWAEDWVPPNIGWESQLAGYRAYWGQFDFFGKTKETLILPDLDDSPKYHAEQPWGIDALHVGETCGLGGVVLYVAGKAYPVWSPNGKGDIEWSKRLLVETDDKVAVQLEAANLGPPEQPCRVRFECAIHAGERHSDISVTVLGGKPDAALQVGVELVRLPDEEFFADKARGVMANTGEQEDAIGPVRMAVVFDPAELVRLRKEETRHEAVLSAEQEEPVQYAIQGDWLRGDVAHAGKALDVWATAVAEAVQGGTG